MIEKHKMTEKQKREYMKLPSVDWRVFKFLRSNPDYNDDQLVGLSMIYFSLFYDEAKKQVKGAKQTISANERGIYID